MNFTPIIIKKCHFLAIFNKKMAKSQWNKRWPQTNVLLKIFHSHEPYNKNTKSGDINIWLPFTPLLKTCNFQYFLWICENPIHSPHLFSFIDCINSTINKNKIWILTASKIYLKSTNTPKLHIFSYFLKFHKKPTWGPPSQKNWT